MEQLLRDLNKDIGELNRLIKKNSVEFEEYKQSEKKREEDAELRLKEFSNHTTEFIAKSLLMIPSKIGDEGSRPLSGINQDSTGLRVKDRDGISRNTILADREYILEADVVNHGDLFVPTINVDFFCSPKYKEYGVEFEIESYNFFLGFATVKGELKKGSLSIGDHVKILARDADFFVKTNGIALANGTDHTISASNRLVTLYVDYDRQKEDFRRIVQPGDLLVEAPDYRQDQRGFRFRIQDVFTITGRGISVTGKVEQGKYELDERLNLFTGSRQGQRSRNLFGISPTNILRRWNNISAIEAGDEVGFLFQGVDKSKFKRGDILVKSNREEFTSSFTVADEPETVNEVEFLGTSTSYVDGLSNNKVTLNWRSPAKKDRRDYVFTARVYSTMPVDMPNNFDDLSPSRDRHVAIKKLNWES